MNSLYFARSNFAQITTLSSPSQITGTVRSGANAGTSSYGYDGAGNRISQNLNGVGTDFSYDPTGRTTAVSRDGRKTSYAYDGLGRQATSTDTTQYGNITTSTVFAGTTPVQQTDNLHGTTTLVRDAAGDLAQQVGEDGEATWALLDRLGSTVAQGVNASITQLSSYSDWGEQKLETAGWSASLNYTGQHSDATQGLDHFAARTYDPGTASWTAPDTWRGLLNSPQTLSRYAYVTNNPIRFLDPDGHRLSEPSADARFNSPTYWIDQQREAEANRIENERVAAAFAGPRGGYRPVPPNAPGPVPVFDPKTHNPIDYSKVQQRHTDTNTNAFFQQPWVGVLSAILGTLGTVAGLISWLPLTPLWSVVMKVVAGVSGGLSTLLTCLSNGIDASCIVSIVVSVIGYVALGLPHAVTASATMMGKKLASWVVEAIEKGSGAFAAPGDIFAMIAGWGAAAG